jgi:hypothetical protein
MMDARLVVCWFNMVAIGTPGGLSACEVFIWNSAARRFDMVQIYGVLFDQCA